MLAGGSGRRFGRPKASVVFAGRTLVERAVTTLQRHCARVIVVSRPEVALPTLVVPVCLDRPGPDAPLTGLATGLSALDTDDVMVLACDLPRAAPVVARLAGLPDGHAAVARAPGDGRIQPLCGRYPRRTTLAACESLLAEGETRLLPLLDALQPSIIDAGTAELSNINSVADLARLARVARLTALIRPPDVGC